MSKTLIAGLGAALLLVVFAIQNASEILVKMFFWEFYISLALIIIVCIIIGAIIGMLFTIGKYKKKLKKKDDVLIEKTYDHNAKN